MVWVLNMKFYFYKENGKYIAVGIEPSEIYDNEEHIFSSFAEAEEHFNNGNPK